MRFKLTLKPVKDGQQLLFNYSYPLQAWVYKLLDRADSKYASFLHEKGYEVLDKNKSILGIEMSCFIPMSLVGNMFRFNDIAFRSRLFGRKNTSRGC